MDSTKLSKALDDPSNEFLFGFTSKKLLQMNFEILKELNLTKTKTKELLKKLKGYKFVDEMNDLKYGTYLRWVSLLDKTNNELVVDSNKIELSRGAIFCDIKITDDGVSLVCKNFGPRSSHFQLKMGECLIFQKLTAQEQVLLSALDHVYT